MIYEDEFGCQGVFYLQILFRKPVCSVCRFIFDDSGFPVNEEIPSEKEVLSRNS